MGSVMGCYYLRTGLLLLLGWQSQRGQSLGHLSHPVFPALPSMGEEGTAHSVAK